MDQITARSETKNYTKAPEGQHQAVLVDVIDLGMHENVYQGVSKGKVQKCALVFQIDETNPDTGKRFEIAKDFTVSMGEKANLRKFLADWRGKSYTDAEAEEGAPLHKLEGVNALIQIEHRASKTNPGRSYANVLSVARLPKKMEPIGLDGYVRGEFWKERMGTKPQATTQFDNDPPPHDDNDFDDFPEALEDQDDDLPF